MANPTSNLGNDPVENKPPPRALSKRELRELRKKEKKVVGEPEIPEVRCDSHLSPRNGILTPPQRGMRPAKPQREKEETESRELKKLEVCRHPHTFRHDGVLTVAGGEAARRDRT